jgi:hypothetical protein
MLLVTLALSISQDGISPITSIKQLGNHLIGIPYRDSYFPPT